MGEEEIEDKLRNKMTAPAEKYEIIGTLEYNFHKQSEDISSILDESKQDEFIEEIMKCGYIIYDITKNEKEIPKALAVLAG